MKKLGVLLLTCFVSLGVMAQSNIWDLTDTWTDSGTHYDSMKMTVTDTAYLAGSDLINFSSVNAGGIFTVDVDGNLVITGTATIGAYTLPATDGTADYYLKTDGVGGVTWAGVSGGFASFVDDEVNGNYAIGLNALDSLTSGSDSNVVFGTSAGTNITNTDDNTFIGHMSGQSNTGNNNTFIGKTAGFSFSGSNNAVIGAESGLNAYSGNSSLLIGFGMEVQHGNDGGQILIGSGAGTYFVDGYFPSRTDQDVTDGVTIFGPSAKSTATVNTSAGPLDLKMGDHATAGGSAGLVRILAPDDSVAFSIDEDGDLAGKTFIADLTNGNYAYGSGAGDSITSGAVDNIAIGNNAGTGITTGDSNITIGLDAGKLINSSSDNIAIGEDTLDGITNSSHGNVAIGSKAADAVANGTLEIVAIGFNALGVANSNVDGMVAVGAYALGSALHPIESVGVGYSAGKSSDDYGTYVGGRAGTTMNGDYNTVLGHNAALGSTSSDWSVIIGASTVAPSLANDDIFVVGNSTHNAIEGYFGARTDVDYSARNLTITGPSAYASATTNQDGGNLVLQGGQKATGGGSNGLALVNDTVYGMIYVTANSTAETTVDTTPRKIAAFDSDGPENGIDADHTTDDITCDTAGTYKITASVSFSGTLSSTFNVEIYKNTTGTGFVLERKLGTGGDIGNSAVVGIVNCAATDTFSLYQYTADGSAMTIHAAQLTAHRLSQ